MRKFILATFVTCLATAAVAQKLSYPLVSTGQVECYDLNGEAIAPPKKGSALYGQDGNYQAGLPMSYRDNGDGTVTDLNTGLIWEQTPSAGPVTWGEAGEYCENLELGGYSDWRLPTLKELFSISNFSAGWPYLDTFFFKLSVEGRVDKDEQYWASEKYVGETVEGRSNAAFGVNHATGHIKAYPAGGGSDDRPQQGNRNQAQRGGQRQGEGQGQRPQMGQRPEGGDSLRMAGGRPPMGQQGGEQGQSQGQRPQMGQRGEQGQQQGGGAPQMMGNPMQKRVRAVRGSVYGVNKFVDNGNGTISDKATGLMWSKDDNGKGVEWSDAIKYAESSKQAGHKDWRLPNVKELQSIVDYRYAPSIKGVTAAIDPIFNCTPFVNEAGDNDYGYYWTSTSALFRGGSPFYFAWYVAFGRAVNNAGIDMHGAGAVRFDTKHDNGMEVEGGEERYYNFVRLVRVEK